jgi:hypothetical protein
VLFCPWWIKKSPFAPYFHLTRKKNKNLSTKNKGYEDDSAFPGILSRGSFFTDRGLVFSLHPINCNPYDQIIKMMKSSYHILSSVNIL